MYRTKPTRHVENVIMMFNNAGDVFGVHNYTQIFPYSTVTSACQGSVLILAPLLFLER